MPIFWKSSMAFTWTAQEARAAASTAAGSETRLSSHSATVQPMGQIAVDQVVGAGLVGDQIGPDAALDQFRQNISRIAQQADGYRLCRRLGLFDQGQASSSVSAMTSR
jgi:hypothetical protein